MPSWSDKYISPPIPFVPCGRDFSGCDCGGLVLLVLREEFGIVALDAEREYEAAHFERMTHDKRKVLEQAIDEAMREWVPIEREEAQAGDMATFAPKGVPCHVGVVIVPGRMLHMEQEAGQSSLADIHGLKWGSSFAGYYRHAKMF